MIHHRTPSLLLGLLVLLTSGIHLLAEDAPLVFDFASDNGNAAVWGPEDYVRGKDQPAYSFGGSFTPATIADCGLAGVLALPPGTRGPSVRWSITREPYQAGDVGAGQHSAWVRRFTGCSGNTTGIRIATTVHLPPVPAGGSLTLWAWARSNNAQERGGGLTMSVGKSVIWHATSTRWGHYSLDLPATLGDTTATVELGGGYYFGGDANAWTEISAWSVEAR